MCPTGLSVSSPDTTFGTQKPSYSLAASERKRRKLWAPPSLQVTHGTASPRRSHKAAAARTRLVLIVCDSRSVNLPACQSLLVTSSSILAVLSQSSMGLNRTAKNWSHLKFTVPAGVEEGAAASCFTPCRPALCSFISPHRTHHGGLSGPRASAVQQLALSPANGFCGSILNHDGQM